jgi:hypothetical protein
MNKKKIIVYFNSLEDVKGNEFMQLQHLLNESCEILCYFIESHSKNELLLRIDINANILYTETKDKFIYLNSEVSGIFYITSCDHKGQKVLKTRLHCSIHKPNNFGFWIDPEEDLDVILIKIISEFELCDLFFEDYYYLENNLFNIKKLTGRYSEFEEIIQKLK